MRTHFLSEIRRRWILIFAIAVFSQNPKATCQSNMLDSLHEVVTTTIADTNKVNTLNLLAHKYRGYNLDSTISIAAKALELANQLRFTHGSCNANYYLGVAHTTKGMREEAIQYGIESLKSAEELKDLGLQSRAHNLLGTVYSAMENAKMASEHLFKAARLASENNDYKRSAYAYISLGSLWRHKDLQKAHQHYQSALDNAIRINDEQLLGTSHSLLGVIAHQKGELRSAIDHGRECIKYATKTNNQRQLDFCLKDLGEFYRAVNELDSSLAYINRAEVRAQRVNNKDLLGDIYSIKGALFKSKGQPMKAIEFYKKGILLTKINNIHFELYDSYQSLSKLQGQVGDYNSAYKNSLLALMHRDSMIYQTHAAELSEANALFESEQKEAEIAQQELQISKQKITRNILLSASAGVISLLSFLFWGIYQRNKRKRKETELALSLEHQRADDLEALGKLKTDFFNNVSHELRTPLTLVIAPLEDALKRALHVDLKGELQLAFNNSKRLLKLTNEILDFSKLDQTSLALEYSEIELKSFLKRIFHSFDSLANSRNITLRDNVISDSPYYVKTDAHKLEKVVTNLVSNALKYSSEGGLVKMSINEEAISNQRLKLHIQDNGRGILKAEQKRIFERFYQSGQTAHSAGTGIGLALVKELTELLGGTISVTSQLGEGSTFFVDLPLELIPSPSVKEEPVLNDESGHVLYPPITIGDSRPSVLIVEDDLEMSKYLISLLSKDYDYDVAYNGLQALQKLKNKKYDLISSDIMMPEMDGFEFRTALNEDEELKGTPFIMLSARVLEEDKLKGFQLGIDDYITKPFSSAEYQARVYNLLKNKISRSEITDNNEQLMGVQDTLIEQAKSLVMEHLDDTEFNVQFLANELNYSTRQLGRILQKMTGLSPVAFILELRLQKAYQLILQQKHGTINEVRYEIGIESASYFSSKFKERFGINPGKLLPS